MTRRPRASLAIHPLLFLLALVLIAIFVWRGWIIADAVQGSSAYASGKRAGAWGAIIGGPIIVFAVAALVGAGGFFAFRRSSGAANAGAGLVLLTAIGLYAYGTYAAATRPRPTGTTARPAATQPPSQALDRMARDSEAQLQAAREQAQRQIERAQEVARTLAATTPSAPQPTPPAPAPDTVSPGVLDALRADLAPVLADLAQAGDAAIKSAAKPKRSRKDLDAQIEALAQLRDGAKASAEKLESIEAQARARLTEAGLDAGAAMAKANRFAVDFKAFEKRIAATTIERLCDTSSEYLTLLRDNVGRWTIDAKGAVTTKDKELERRLFGPMHQTQFAIDQARDAVATLRLK